MATSQALSVDPSLIQSVIRHESNYQVDAVSHAEAKGLMQLMPIAVEEVKRKSATLPPICTTVQILQDDYFQPIWNVVVGSCYLKLMLVTFDGDIEKAIAAYNFGPTRVRKGNKWPKETRDYVARVMKSYIEPAYEYGSCALLTDPESGYSHPSHVVQIVGYNKQGYAYLWYTDDGKLSCCEEYETKFMFEALFKPTSCIEEKKGEASND